MPTLWLLVEDGLTGTENQLKAIAARLQRRFPDLNAVRKPIRRGSWFLPRWESDWYWPDDQKPDLVLAAGNLAILPASSMKNRGAHVAFLQDPRWLRSKFDAIYAPHHDPANGANVVKTDGTITPIEACASAPENGTVFFIVGGARKGKEGTLDHNVLNALKQAQTCLVTFSRRTPEATRAQIRSALPNAEIYDPAHGGDNPYRAWLCRAETILVTDDSTAMASDAASTGRGVYIVPYIKPTGRLAKFHRHLQDIGAVKVFDGALISYTPARVLNDADKVAHDIEAKFLKG